MQPLSITLTGTVNSSNFEQWKTDLLFEIQATNFELLSDEDFVGATQQVKRFKAAETALKQAKQSAISQAEAINRLFSAIDEIGEESRQARLSLERQIKTRKAEIKAQFIQSGMDRVQASIEQHADTLGLLDVSAHLDRARFESAVRGKAGTKGVEAAIARVCDEIEQQIAERVANLRNNQSRLETLPDAHKLLFQDAAALIDLPASDLQREIDKRIARYNEDGARQQATQYRQALQQADDIELNPEQAEPASIDPPLQEKFRITVDLLASRDQAMELARAIKAGYSDIPAITAIKLSRNRDSE